METAKSQNNVRGRLCRGGLHGIALSALLISPLASAQYEFELVMPPGATSSNVFGLNNAGLVTGTAEDESGFFSFVYDSEKDEYSVASGEFSPLEISNNGTMVGHIAGLCAIQDKQGEVTMFAPPSATAESRCEARGINSSGDVTGILVDETGTFTAFTHDPKKGTFEEYLSSSQTISTAINAKGQTAGNATLADNEAYPGSVAGRYGYIREKNGDTKFFEINLSLPGFTRARGVSESGLVSGFYTDAATFDNVSFVTTLAPGTDFESITLSAEEIIFRNPCNPDVPPPPALTT